MKTLKKAQKGGPNIAKTDDKKKYQEQYTHLKEARNAIGKNDKKKLSELGLNKSYNSNDLAKDYSKAQALRKKAGLGISEEIKLSFPQVGQQIRGAVNRIAGTNLKKGGSVKSKKKK